MTRIKSIFALLHNLVRSNVNKLRRLGFQNQIVIDSKSDFNEFGRQLYDDSDFKVEIVLRLYDDFGIRLKLTNFGYKSVDFDLFLTILKTLVILSPFGQHYQNHV